MDLDLVEEDIPVVVREAGPGREPVKWEQHLSPVKEAAGKSYRIFTYAKQTAATSRAAAIRKRLWDATPSDDFELKVRPVPDSNPVTYGVYARYKGERTDEEIKAEQDRRAKRLAQQAAASAQQQAAVAAAPDLDAPTPGQPQTAAQKVAAAKKAAATK